MISIVVVSHSRALARAAVALAEEMVPDELRPRMVIAAGLDEETTGTDATAIAAAIEELDGPDGTLVLVDLGSAVLSAEMALDFVDPEVASRVKISSAPLVEGLVAAAVSASGRADLETVDGEADQSLAPKREQLGRSQPVTGQVVRATAAARPVEPGNELELRMPVHNQHGLHARPCASIVSVIAGLDAVVMLRRGDRAPDEAVDGRSIMAVQSLGVRQGDELVATITGRQAHLAHRALAELAAKNFGDGQAEHQPDRVASTLGELPIHELQLTVPVDDYRPGTRDEELGRLETALANTDGFLEGLAAKMPDQSVTGAVLRAIRSILHDPMLAQGFRDRIAEGRSAVAAVQGTMQDAIAVFETMSNPYLRERGTDLRALQRTLLASLMETEDLSMTGVPAGHLVLVDELDAITASQLDPLAVPGVLTRTSGSNGHGLVVANDRGLTVHLVAAG